MYLTKSIW